MNHQVGSDDSIMWLKALKDAENNDIYLSNLRILVDYKWEKVQKMVFIDMFFHILYAVLIGVDATLFDNPTQKMFKVSKIWMT